MTSPYEQDDILARAYPDPAVRRFRRWQLWGLALQLAILAVLVLTLVHGPIRRSPCTVTLAPYGTGRVLVTTNPGNCVPVSVQSSP